MNKSEIATIVGDVNLAELVLEKIMHTSENLLHHLDIGTRSNIQTIAQSLRKPALGLTERDFLTSSVPAWGASTLFQQSFARLFVLYRNIKLQNKLAKLAASEGDTSHQFLTEDDFHRQYGVPPGSL